MTYKELYHKRKEAGLCVKCGEPARKDRTTCLECATFEAKQRLQYYREKHPNPKPRGKERRWEYHAIAYDGTEVCAGSAQEVADKLHASAAAVYKNARAGYRVKGIWYVERTPILTL